MSSVIKFDSGPKVCIHIQMVNGAMQSSRLFLSDQFSCVGGDSFLIEWLKLYSQKKAPIFPLDFVDRLFRIKVLKEMARIPFGQTVSYGQLAERCGRPKAARAVGSACKKNPFPIFIPCHRVIQSNGKLGGFAFGEEMKARLLDFER